MMMMINYLGSEAAATATAEVKNSGLCISVDDRLRPNCGGLPVLVVAVEFGFTELGVVAAACDCCCLVSALWSHTHIHIILVNQS